MSACTRHDEIQIDARRPGCMRTRCASAEHRDSDASVALDSRQAPSRLKPAPEAGVQRSGPASRKRCSIAFQNRDERRAASSSFRKHFLDKVHVHRDGDAFVDLDSRQAPSRLKPAAQTIPAEVHVRRLGDAYTSAA